MSSICERCPIITKAARCCGSHPETRAYKILVGRRTRIKVQVCPQLQTDGSCGDYLKRPDACRANYCDKLYAKGLGAS